MNKTIHSLIVSDWAPHIEKTVRLIAVPIAAAYVAGLMVGTWIHQLNDALTQLTTPRQALQTAPVTMAAPVAVKVQRCAVAPVIARAGLLPQDPMDRAVLAVRTGMSQAAAARQFGVSRSTLRRRLK